jgi:hypothetical protein
MDNVWFEEISCVCVCVCVFPPRCFVSQVLLSAATNVLPVVHCQQTIDARSDMHAAVTDSFSTTTAVLTDMV